MRESDYVDTLMDNVKIAIEDMAENNKDDDFVTTKDINKLVLVATVNEFIVIDRDKFQTLEISKSNRFRI